MFTCVLDTTNNNISSDDVHCYRFIKDTGITEMVDQQGSNIHFTNSTISNTLTSELTITNSTQSHTGYYWVGTPSFNVCNVSLTVLASMNIIHYDYDYAYICDQICQKGSYTRTASGLTFHYHSTDTTIDQQFMLVPLPNLQRSAFNEASFTGLSGVHGCSGGLLMASACPARQTDSWQSPQDWLVRLGIDLATF